MKTATIDVYNPWGTRGYLYVVRYRGAAVHSDCSYSGTHAEKLAAALETARLFNFTHYKLLGSDKVETL